MTTKLLALFAAIAPVVSLGCVGVAERSSPSSEIRAMDILFSADGKEHGQPSIEVWKMLKRVKLEERSAVVESLLDILDRPGGYARLAVADAIFDDPSYWSLSKRGAIVIARNLIRVAHPVPKTVPDYWLREYPEEADSLHYLIEPHCVLYVDGREVILSDGLPEGWVLESAAVVLDGKVIVDNGVYPKERYGPYPKESVVLADFLKPDELYGKHEIVSRATLKAPDGTRIPLERKIVIKVVTPEHLFDDTPITH